MEENLVQNESVEEEEEEYVLLNLDEVRGQVDIPPNAPYVLSVCFSTCNFHFFLKSDLYFLDFMNYWLNLKSFCFYYWYITGFFLRGSWERCEYAIILECGDFLVLLIGLKVGTSEKNWNKFEGLSIFGVRLLYE